MRFAFLASLALPLFAHAQPSKSAADLWANNCQNCHGDKGQGGGAGTRTLLTDELFDQKHDRPFFDAIKNGLPDKGMAPFGETLDNKQVWGLVNFIRELQGRSLPHPATPNKAGLVKTKHLNFTIQTVASESLDTPWGVEFLPSSHGSGPIMVVTNRPGFLSLFKDGKLLAKIEKAQGMPPVWNSGQGGLLDITIDPRYSQPGNDFFYLAFSDPSDNGKKSTTKIVRGKIKNTDNAWAWTDQQTLFEAKPEHYSNSGIHFGSQIVFDPADPETLFFSIGERGAGDHAQDLNRPNGKVHRIRRDGSIPLDNPFVAASASTPASPYPSIWSFGHRNPQGLTFDLHNRLFDTEHGPRGGDELNLVLKAQNYGWPIISFGINYSGAPLVTPWADTATPNAQNKNFVMPIDRWMPSVGVCGLDTVRSDSFTPWNGDLLAGGLSGSSVDRFRISPPSQSSDSPTVVEREEVLRSIGRVRDIFSAPDSSIYIVTNGPDRVIKLVPAPAK